MGIQKFINDSNEKIFHTSGFANVAHGDAIGSTSAESFNRRREIAHKREKVRSYGDSLVGRGMLNEADRKAVGARPILQDTAGSKYAPRASRQQMNARPMPIQPRSNFSGRSFNPYQ